MAEVGALLQQLEAIETACQEQRWNDAEALMQEYEQAVRAVSPTHWTQDSLNDLLQRQQKLAELMLGGRDSASAELGQIGASRRGAKAYSG